MDSIMGVVGQGAAVPHRGLSYIQDLITHCFLVVVEGEVIRDTQTAGPPSVPEEVEGEGEELERKRRGEGRDRKVGPVSSKEKEGSNPLKARRKSRGDVGGAQEERHGKGRQQSDGM